MKALTKPEKFQAMSRIYGYLECEWDVAPGTVWEEIVISQEYDDEGNLIDEVTELVCVEVCDEDQPSEC